MIKETLICLDGPLEDTEIKRERRSTKVYDEFILDDEEGNKYKYVLVASGGLRYLGKVE